MAKRTCALCGHTVGFFTQFTESCWLPNGEYYAVNPIPIIPNAESDYGFCELNGCSKYVSQITKRMNETKYADIEKAIDYCKRHVDSAPPVIKAYLQSALLKATEELSSIENTKNDITRLLDQISSSETNLKTTGSVYRTESGTLICKTERDIVITADHYKICDKLETLLSEMKNSSSMTPDLLSKIKMEFRIIRDYPPKYKPIPLDNIIFFKEYGNVQYTSEVSGGGGGGGGVNLQGAVLGGALFGTAGAIIGSQYGTDIKIDPTLTTTQKRDDRTIQFRYKNDQGKIEEKIYPYDCYEVFMYLIPEKEYSYTIMPSNTTDTQESTNESNTVPSNSIDKFEEIRKFKELLDNNIITEEEFDQKKKQLLDI